MYPSNGNSLPAINPENNDSLFCYPSRPLAGGVTVKEGQAPITCPSLVANRGVDTAHLTYSAVVPGELIIALSEQKRAIQRGEESESLFRFGSSNVFSFNLQRTGFSWYQFILKSGDVTICFSTRKYNSTIPNMAIYIGSLSCQDNLPELHKSLMMWLSYHRIQVMEEKTQRLDMCCDVAMDIEFTGVEEKNRIITKVTNITTEEAHYRLTGKVYGKGGDLSLRVYDKIEEMTVKQSEQKEKFFRAIWGDVEDITRFEFQMRRPIIKQMFPRKSDLMTVLKFKDKIWSYLTNDWFRMTKYDVDRKNKHQARAESSILWQQIQMAFSAEEVRPLARRRKQKHININPLIKQAVGCMISVCAGVGHVVEDVAGMYTTIHNLMSARLLEYFDGVDFRQGYESRLARGCVSF